jgi:hypothetical protein
MLSAEASSAICVQRFDDSRNSAIHTTYRISLRSSSLREPRYPLLRVVSVRMQRPGLLHIMASWFWFGVKKLLGWASPPAAPPRGSSWGPGSVHSATGAAGSQAALRLAMKPGTADQTKWFSVLVLIDSMILPQVHLRKPCYDFSFL